MRAKTVNEIQNFERGGNPMETLRIGKGRLNPFLFRKLIGDNFSKEGYSVLKDGFGGEEIYYFGDEDFYRGIYGDFYNLLDELTSGVEPFYEKTYSYEYNTKEDGIEPDVQEEQLVIYNTKVGKIGKISDPDDFFGSVLYVGDFEAASNLDLTNKKKLLL